MDKYHLYLNSGNKSTIENSFKNNLDYCNLTFFPDDYHQQPNEIIWLTKKQADKYIKHKQEGRTCVIHIDTESLKHNLMNGSGILDIAKGLLPLLGKLAVPLGLGVLTGVGTAIGNKVTSKIADKVEGKGLEKEKVEGYFPHFIHLTDDHMKKIKEAYEHDRPISIGIKKENLNGNHKIFLTKTQIHNIETGKGLDDKTIRIHLSRKQLKSQKGGDIGEMLGTLASSILPMFLGLGLDNNSNITTFKKKT